MATPEQRRSWEDQMATTTKQKRKVVRKSRGGGVTTTAILTWFREHVGLKTQLKQLDAREKEVKGRLMEAVQSRGYEDSEGHWWFDLPEEIGGYSKLKREKRVTQILDQEKALELVKSKGLKQCVKTIEVIDEEELTKARFEKKISDDEFKLLIDTNVTWAFVPRK